jgi:hypothetical protein
MKRAALLLLVLGACGGSSSTSHPDAHVGPDATPITISGTAEELKNLAPTGLANTTVTAFAVAGDQQLGMATTGTDGTYSISVSTALPLDGYLLGHHADVGTTMYIDDYLYPPHPLSGDETGGVILMLTPNTLGLIEGVLSVQQDSSKGMLGLVVADGNGNTLAGATITTEPAATVYYDSGSLPSTTASMTDTDGRAYILNLPPGAVTVHATMGSTTLHAHTVNARAGVVTTTAIEP